MVYRQLRAHPGKRTPVASGEWSDRSGPASVIRDMDPFDIPACKGRKKGCPVNVDIARYKAEFLSHHYHHRIRPRHAYMMGLIEGERP